jgi:hypothetical protein
MRVVVVVAHKPIQEVLLAVRVALGVVAMVLLLLDLH